MVCSHKENLYLVRSKKRYMLYTLVHKKLVTLERVLLLRKRLPVTQPSPQAMQSHIPFAADTMSFEQWLQFIFFPQMYQLINQKRPLPRQMGLAPMAEYVWGNDPALNDLIKQFKAFDFLFDDIN